MERLFEWCVLGTSLCAKSEVWAAWWQGVGTVAAVFVAVGVAAHGRRAARDDHVQSQQTKSANAARMAQLFAAQLQSALGSYGEACDSVDGPGDFSTELFRELRRISAVLNNLAYWPPIVETAYLHTAAVVAFLQLCSIAEQARVEAREVPGPDEFWRLQQSFRELRASAETHLNVLRTQP
jgi:hypothetical protein